MLEGTPSSRKSYPFKGGRWLSTNVDGYYPDQEYDRSYTNPCLRGGLTEADAYWKDLHEPMPQVRAYRS